VCVAKRTSSRLRSTNDRFALGVHEDHEDDKNAEIGVSLHAQGEIVSMDFSMVYINNSAINQYQGGAYNSESEDFNLLNVEDFRDDISPEERERLINFFTEAVNTQNKDEALARYNEIKALRDMSKFKRDVSLNAMLTSAGYDSIRHSRNYQESSTAYLAFENLIGDLESVLGSK